MAGIPRYAARRDKVELDVVKQLRSISGISVEVISIKNVGDLLIGFRGVTYLIELKSKGGKLTDGQKQFHNEWTGQHAICTTLEDILKVIGF